MAKTTAKNIFNALKKIGVSMLNLANDTPFSYPIRNYSLTLEEVQDVLSENTNFSNYDLLKHFLLQVMHKNQNDDLALFVCYELLGKYGKMHNVESYQEHFEKAMHYHLKWQLTQEFAMVLSDRGCCQCVHLNDSIFKSSEVLRDFPLKAKQCEFGMFRCSVISMSEGAMKRRLSR
jgi:hypothetical protein